MSDQNLFAENARLEAENAALRDGLQMFFPLRSKLQDVITTAQEIDRHNKALILAGNELEDWVLIMRLEHPKDIESIRKVCLNWHKAKGSQLN
jgi:hypothetical protein